MGADRLPTKGPTSSFERLADSWRLEPLPSGRLGVNEALRAPVVWMSGFLVVFAVAGASVSSITTGRFGFITGALIAVAAGAALVLTANMRQRTFARTFRAMTAVTKGAFIAFVLTSIASTSALAVIGVAVSSWNLDGKQANLLVVSLSVLSVTLTAGYVTAMPPAVSLDWRGSRLPRLIAVSAGVVQASAVLILVTSYASASPVAAVAGLPVALGLAGLTAAFGLASRSRRQRAELADLLQDPQRLLARAPAEDGTRSWVEVETSLLVSAFSFHPVSVDVFLRDALFALHDVLNDTDRTFVSPGAERHFARVLEDLDESEILALFEDGCAYIRGRLLRVMPRVRDQMLQRSPPRAKNRDHDGRAKYESSL